MSYQTGLVWYVHLHAEWRCWLWLLSWFLLYTHGLLQ